jgi:hypothetical protein
MAKEKSMGGKHGGKGQPGFGKKEAGFSSKVGKGKHGFGKEMASPAK